MQVIFYLYLLARNVVAMTVKQEAYATYSNHNIDKKDVLFEILKL